MRFRILPNVEMLDDSTYKHQSMPITSIGPSVMTDANCEGFPICDDRITENDRCVIKIIGIH